MNGLEASVSIQYFAFLKISITSFSNMLTYVKNPSHYLNFTVKPLCSTGAWLITFSKRKKTGTFSTIELNIKLSDKKFKTSTIKCRIKWKIIQIEIPKVSFCCFSLNLFVLSIIELKRISDKNRMEIWKRIRFCLFCLMFCHFHFLNSIEKDLFA